MAALLVGEKCSRTSCRLRLFSSSSLAIEQDLNVCKQVGMQTFDCLSAVPSTLYPEPSQLDTSCSLTEVSLCGVKKSKSIQHLREHPQHIVNII